MIYLLVYQYSYWDRVNEKYYVINVDCDKD